MRGIAFANVTASGMSRFFFRRAAITDPDGKASGQNHLRRKVDSFNFAVMRLDNRRRMERNLIMPPLCTYRRA